MPVPSKYEQTAIRSIHAWRNPENSWLSTAGEKVSEAWKEVTRLAEQIPGVEWTMKNVVAGVLDLTNEITLDSVWSDAIYREYRDAGHLVETGDDIRLLDLEQIDPLLTGLNAKYSGLAAAEGTATGLAGAAGIVPDLIALVSLNLRAAGEFACYCGYDVSESEERLFALELLDSVASSGNKTREVTLAPAVRTATRVARTQSSQALEQMGVMTAIERAARALGLKLTEAKLAQVVPIAGAVIAGGFNAYYTSRVCKTAYYLYRERFLVLKYGEDILTEFSRVD